MERKRTFNSKAVSYAAVSAALGTLFLTVGAYTGLGEFFWYFAASVCVMITYAARSIFVSLLSFMACAGLSLLTTGFNFIFLLPYLVFFGAYPVVLYIENRQGKCKWLTTVLSCIWFNAAMYVLYLFTKLFVTEITFINDNIIIIILAGGTLIFFLYRFVMKRIMQKFETRFKKRSA